MDYEIYEIEGPYAQIDEQTGHLQEYLEEKFADADDVSYGRYLIDQLNKLEDVWKHLIALKNIHDGILDDEGLSPWGDSTMDPKSSLREFSIEITKGMINQSLLTLTQPKKLGLIEHGEKMTIKTPVGNEFSTEVLAIGNRLKERGRIGAFYEHAKVEPQDRVILKETKPGYWRLSVDHAHRERIKAARKAISEL
jgi:hypothetical protein